MNNTKEKNKKTYITPMIEVIEFDCVDDILTDSANGTLGSRLDYLDAGTKVWGTN